MISLSKPSAAVLTPTGMAVLLEAKTESGTFTVAVTTEDVSRARVALGLDSEQQVKALAVAMLEVGRLLHAGPAAVRLVLEALPLLVDLQRAAEGSAADAEVLGLYVNLSRARLAELVKLNAQVTAALEGRS